MKVKDMKAGVAYATCDRRFVVPVEPIASDYRQASTYNEKLKKHELSFTRDADGDPWQSCGTSRRGAKGVLVTAFDVDKNGEAVGKGHKQVISIRDIAGTWAEYLSLHAEDVKKRGEERERILERIEAKKALAAAASTAFKHLGTVTADAYPRIAYNPRTHERSGTTEEYIVGIKMNPQQFKRFMKEHG